MLATEAVKKKIATTEDLQSVVTTMKTLAAVSIRQYERAEDSLESYLQTVEAGMQALLRRAPNAAARLPADAPHRRPCAVIIGSDQGMCGRLNELVAGHALEHIGRDGIERWIAVTIGLQAAGRVEGAGLRIVEQAGVPGSADAITPAVQELIMVIEDLRTNRNVDYIRLFFNEHASGASFRPVDVQLFPLDRRWIEKLRTKSWPTRMLPALTMDWDALFAALIRQYVFVALYRGLAESLASENASRLAAMQGAERSIRDRLEELTSRYRQQRQAEITEELLDIVSGFTALRHEQNTRQKPDGNLVNRGS